MAVEAPAGCGKTHETVWAAVRLASEIRDGREVLLLAHTNAAVWEFRRRIRQTGARVRASTLDAFALELVAPYAAPLELPTPLVPGEGPGRVAFRSLAPKAVELLRRAPTLARALGQRYPLVFVDEHQDTRVEQQELVARIVGAHGSRLRTFADPMQAIYRMDELLDWDDHCRQVDRVEALDQPHRWREVPELGAWIMAAREALRRGDVLPLGTRPPCVSVHRVAGLDDTPNPRSRRVQPELLGPLRSITRGVEGSLAVLTRYNAHVRGLNAALRGRLVIQEGAEFASAYDALDLAEGSLGNPRQMALVAIELLKETCTGFTAQLSQQVTASLLADRIDRGRRKRIRPLLECFEPLYSNPDMSTWCRSIQCIVANPPDWLKLDLPLNLRLLAQLRPNDETPARLVLDEVARRYREGAPALKRCVSTIHKAKGQEYDHVVLANCGTSIFPDTEEGRRLLYTAASRARKSLTLVAPGASASPLLG